jgi:hypothetical protein
VAICPGLRPTSFKSSTVMSASCSCDAICCQWDYWLQLQPTCMTGACSGVSVQSTFLSFRRSNLDNEPWLWHDQIGGDYGHKSWVTTRDMDLDLGRAMNCVVAVHFLIVMLPRIFLSISTFGIHANIIDATIHVWQVLNEKLCTN